MLEPAEACQLASGSLCKVTLTNYSTQVAKCHEECHADSSFPRGRKVICSPRNDSNNSWVQASGDEKQHGVGKSRVAGVRNGQQPDEANT